MWDEGLGALALLRNKSKQNISAVEAVDYVEQTLHWETLPKMRVLAPFKTKTTSNYVQILTPPRVMRVQQFVLQNKNVTSWTNFSFENEQFIQPSSSGRIVQANTKQQVVRLGVDAPSVPTASNRSTCIRNVRTGYWCLKVSCVVYSTESHSRVHLCRSSAKFASCNASSSK